LKSLEEKARERLGLCQEERLTRLGLMIASACHGAREKMRAWDRERLGPGESLRLRGGERGP